MNTPQNNRIIFIVAQAEKCNNYLDDDFLQEAINDLSVAENITNAVWAIENITSSIAFRSGKYPQSLKAIEQWKDELIAYESLLEATQRNNEAAVEYWMKKAKPGEVMKLI